jgi:hypothetical protein
MWGCSTGNVTGIIFGGGREEMWGDFEKELLKSLGRNNDFVLEVRDLSVVGSEKFYLLFADFKVYVAARVVEGSY